MLKIEVRVLCSRSTDHATKPFVLPAAAELVIYFHCGYAGNMAVELVKLNQLFFLCSIATRCSAICVPDRPMEPLFLQLFVQIEGYHQRSVGPAKMPCYRQGQNHISVFRILSPS